MMKTNNPIFKNKASQQAYEGAYTRTLATDWSIKTQSQYIETAHGRTHVLTFGEQDAPPLLLLHGFGFSATMWYTLAPAFVHHYRVFAPDTIGDFGKSVPVQFIKNRQEYATWLLDLLDGLSIQQTDVIGMSYGGWLAATLALVAPERIKQLVLLSPAGTFAPVNAGFMVRGMIGRFLPYRSILRAFMRYMLVNPAPLHHAVSEQFICGMQCTKLTPSVLADVFTDEELSSIYVPTLLMCGEREIIYQPATVFQRAKATMPQVETILIPNAGHGIVWDQTEQVSKYLTRFLQAVKVAS